MSTKPSSFYDLKSKIVTHLLPHLQLHMPIFISQPCWNVKRYETIYPPTSFVAGETKEMGKSNGLTELKNIIKTIFVRLGISCNMIHIILLRFKGECSFILCAVLLQFTIVLLPSKKWKMQKSTTTKLKRNYVLHYIFMSFTLRSFNREYLIH